MSKVTKEICRCKNCGDKTTFASNADHERVTMGWCVPCYKQWQTLGPGRNTKALNPPEWKEPRGLNDRTPYDSR